MSESRKIAAILAADVVGYSRLASADEDRTLARLRALRSDLIDPVVAVHHGRVVKRTGDGSLIEFRSVVEAVRCAIEVQNGMVERNAGLPPERRIEFRVGIHLGDVVEESDGDLMGSGVNIAARLEGIAKPGGICLSEDAYRQVKGRLDLPVSDLGDVLLKNIPEPVRVYALEIDARPHQGTPVATEPSATPPALPDKPSIAVLPFQNMGGDAEQEYFADGVVEDIITALSRFNNLFVIARNSSFVYKGRAVDVKHVGRELGVRYILEGSVRKAGNRVRITGQLIDTATGSHLWAERFDGGLEDIFELQDQVTASVVGAVAPKLEQAEIERAVRKPTGSLDAYDRFLRGMASFYQQTRESVSDALRLFYSSIEIDPENATPYGMASMCLAFRKANGWATDSLQEFAEAERLAQRAVQFGADDAVALYTAGFALAHACGEVNIGIDLIERALDLNPNLANAWTTSGHVNVYYGRVDRAIEHLTRAMRLSPLDPFMYTMQVGMAQAHFQAHRYEEAASWSAKAIRSQPTFMPAWRNFVAGNALAGRQHEAQRALSRLRELDPPLRLSNLA
jgi:adenylate cyclase